MATPTSRSFSVRINPYGHGCGPRISGIRAAAREHGVDLDMPWPFFKMYEGTKLCDGTVTGATAAVEAFLRSGHVAPYVTTEAEFVVMMAETHLREEQERLERAKAGEDED